MSSGEIAFLALALGVLLSFVGLTVYGVAVASERPTQTDSAPAPTGRMASQHH